MYLLTIRRRLTSTGAKRLCSSTPARMTINSQRTLPLPRTRSLRHLSLGTSARTGRGVITDSLFAVTWFVFVCAYLITHRHSFYIYAYRTIRLSLLPKKAHSRLLSNGSSII